MTDTGAWYGIWDNTFFVFFSALLSPLSVSQHPRGTDVQ